MSELKDRSGRSLGATKTVTRLDDGYAARARRFVATVARGREDCALLLDALGLVPDGMRLTVEVRSEGHTDA